MEILNIQFAVLMVAIALFAAALYSSYKRRKFERESFDYYIDLMQQHLQQQCCNEYTKRYQDIIIKMPSDLSAASFDDIEVPMRLYFDLCNEEYYLWMNCHIDNDIWQLWKKSMVTTMQQRIFEESWMRLKELYDNEFCSFFEREIMTGHKIS